MSINEIISVLEYIDYKQERMPPPPLRISRPSVTVVIDPDCDDQAALIARLRWLETAAAQASMSEVARAAERKRTTELFRKRIQIDALLREVHRENDLCT